MKRFWILKYVQQQGITEVEATLFKDNLVRADHLPLVLPVAGAQGLPRFARVLVRLGDIDEVSLDIHGTVSQRLDGGEDDKGAASQEAQEDESDDDTLAGPIAIAVDLSEGDVASGPAPGAAAPGDNPTP